MDYGYVLGEENKQRVKESLKADEHGDTPWPRSGHGLKDSAVLIPLLKVNGEASVLFTLRARDLSRHRNQVRYIHVYGIESSLSLEKFVETHL